MTAKPTSATAVAVATWTNRCRVHAPWRDRGGVGAHRSPTATTATRAGCFTAATGLSYAWLGAMHVPGQVLTYLPPSAGVGSLLGLTTVDRARLRVATWLTALVACYGVIDFAGHNGLVAFGVSGGLALLWVATGHDRELVHPGDPRRPH